MSNNKPRKAPEVGQSVSYMGRKITTRTDGMTEVSKKGRPEPVLFPNFSRAMDAISFACGL